MARLVHGRKRIASGKTNGIDAPMGSAPGFGGIDQGLNAVWKGRGSYRGGDSARSGGSGGTPFGRRRGVNKLRTEKESEESAHMPDYTRIMKPVALFLFLGENNLLRI